jgi:hypothetical protein
MVIESEDILMTTKNPAFQKTYLGDAVYAEVRDGMIWLTTENGISVTNEIALEVEVFEALVRYGVRAGVKLPRELVSP